MTSYVLAERRGPVSILTLNRPEVLNAWHRPMRDQLVSLLKEAEADPDVRAIILTGAGDRAFGAGQDLNETKSFDSSHAEGWMDEWKRLYGTIRGLSKPLIAALNGVAAGSAFQVSLLADFRIAHDGVKMGQPEIDSGIPSVTGPWIMRNLIGLAHTVDLTLTGRMLDADESFRLGLISRLVARDAVMSTAIELAGLLSEKPPVAMRLNKQRFAQVTQDGFEDAMAAGIGIQQEAYGTGEPARMMTRFLETRAQRKKGGE